MKFIAREIAPTKAGAHFDVKHMNNPISLDPRSTACFLLGCAGVVLALSMTMKNAAFIKRSVRVPGTVVELVATGHKRAMAPKFEFTDTSGQRRTVISAVSSYPPRHKVGEEVQVLFDPVGGEAKLAAWMELRGGEVFLGIFSGLLVMGGLCGIILSLS